MCDPSDMHDTRVIVRVSDGWGVGVFDSMVGNALQVLSNALEGLQARQPPGSAQIATTPAIL
jgi:hypothetical protein